MLWRLLNWSHHFSCICFLCSDIQLGELSKVLYGSVVAPPISFLFMSKCHSYAQKSHLILNLFQIHSAVLFCFYIYRFIFCVCGQWLPCFVRLSIPRVMSLSLVSRANTASNMRTCFALKIWWILPADEKYLVENDPWEVRASKVRCSILGQNWRHFRSSHSLLTWRSHFQKLFHSNFFEHVSNISELNKHHQTYCKLKVCKIKLLRCLFCCDRYRWEGVIVIYRGAEGEICGKFEFWETGEMGLA